MPSLGLLPERFYDAALDVSNAVSERKGYSSMLIGGAALMAHRMDLRFTKDLDFNLSRFDTRLRRSFLDHHISISLNPKRPNKFKGHHLASAPRYHDNVKIDFAVLPDVEALLRYTVKMNGIIVAKIPLLLVQKVVTSAERPLPLKTDKVTADLDDVLFCLNNLVKQRNTKVPDDELLRYRLTEEIWRGFWDRVSLFKPEKLGRYRRLLCEVGLLDMYPKLP